MRVIVPAVPNMLHPAVVPAILRDGYRAEVVPMLGAESYYELLADLWVAAEDFAIVEHDVEIGHLVLEGFDRCAMPWCAHSYDVFGGDLAETYGGAWGLGCVRFRAELLRAIPEAIVVAGEAIHGQHPPRSYAVLDAGISQCLRGPHRRMVHQHHPAVTHHHRYDRENAYVTDEMRRTMPAFRDHA